MRKARVLKEKSYYHVTAKSNRKEFIFKTQKIKQLYMDVLKKAKKKFNFTLKNFCIMDNHIHLLIKPWVGECLSTIMKWIQQIFAYRFNKLFGYGGHVWYERFFSEIIRSKKRIITVFNYITENPIRANLVNKAEDYKYGGFYWIKQKIFDLVDPPGFLIFLIN